MEEKWSEGTKEVKKGVTLKTHWSSPKRHIAYGKLMKGEADVKNRCRECFGAL